MMGKDTKDLRQIIKAAESQGWNVKMGTNGHWRFTPPDPTKPIVRAAGTPSDHRWKPNLIGQLRRSGFIWPWPPR